MQKKIYTRKAYKAWYTMGPKHLNVFNIHIYHTCRYMHTLFIYLYIYTHINN